MIDDFALAVSHGLMMLAAFLLLRRPDLDREAAADAPPGTPPRDRARPGRLPRA